MAERALTAAAPLRGTGPLGRLLVLRPAVAVAVVYLAARVVTTGFLLVAAELSGPTSRFGADATIGTLSMGWDAQWYWVVGSAGYPTHLPVDATGAVTQNAWAFMPVYPALTRVLSVVFAGNYPLAAVVLAIVAGYGACLAFFHLLREKLEADAALWAVALLAASPLAALFQMGYAESLFLLWLFLALRLLLRRRFVWLYPLIVVMGYTRPGVLAFALLLGAYGVMRWVRRRDDPLPPAQVMHIVALGVLAVVVGFSWQVIAGIVTGDPAAYMETELSWRRGWIGEGGFVPFSGFVQASAIWFRVWGLPEVWGYVALALVTAAAAAVLLFEPHMRRLGVEIRLWSASYLIYLLLVFFPQSSIFRLLFPLAPLAGALAVPRRTSWRLAVLAVGVLGQWWWIDQMLVQGTTFTQIP